MSTYDIKLSNVGQLSVAFEENVLTNDKKDSEVHIS